MKVLITNDSELLNESCIPDNIQKQILGKIIDVERIGLHPINYFVKYRGYLLLSTMFKVQQNS